MARRINYKFQTFVDLATSTTSMQVIQWSVGGNEVIRRCKHLFGAFKYFKLGKISIKLVPASTLPVDPLGLSYDVDDPQTVDPVDQMNLGLVRITNGEDVFTNVSALTAEQQDRAYKTMLLDPRWSKFQLQSGFRRSAYPLYWQVGQLSQDKYPGSITNIPIVTGASPFVAGVCNECACKTSVNDAIHSIRTNGGSSARGLFQTGMRGRLGFLPTDYFQQVAVPSSVGGDTRFVDEYGLNNIPEVKVITAILPKASKTVYYYRCYITEYVTFTGLRSSVPFYDPNELGVMQGSLGIDNFLYGGFESVLPGQNIGDPIGISVSNGSIINNGGENLP